MTATIDVEPTDAREPRKLRWFLLGFAALLVAVGLFLTLVASDARLSFDLEGPAEPVSAGDDITIRAPDGDCGPLIITLHEEAILGFWDQTHSGNVIDGFARDERAWWSLGSSEQFTPVPCATGGATTFTLPDDVPSGVMAACDGGGSCARFRVAG